MWSRSLPFSTDEFFAAIREYYNRRTEDSDFSRLTFCLLGVATPSDLICDTRASFNGNQPANRVERLPEKSGTPTQARLGTGREGGCCQSGFFIGPMKLPLTRRLCRALAQGSSVTGPAGVDHLCGVAVSLEPGTRK
jgi:hypothetical protein